MAADPEGLVSFEAAGVKYTAVFGLRAEKAVEAHYDLPFLRAIANVMPDLSAEDLANKAKILEASLDIRFTEIARLFEFALLKHHRDLTEDQIEDLWDEIGGADKASQIVGKCLVLSLGVEDDDSSTVNPPPGDVKKKTGRKS